MKWPPSFPGYALSLWSQKPAKARIPNNGEHLLHEMLKLRWFAKSRMVRAGDKLNVQQSARLGIDRETDGPHLAYHLQIAERIVIRLLYFFGNFLNRLGFTRAHNYLDNLSLKFCGIILDVHCRKNFGISWADKRTGRFLTDLRSRIDGRFQFTTDGYEAYKTCASRTLGPDVDFAQLIKLYANPKDNDGERRYSASQCIGTRTVIRHGKPDSSQISTSYVERANLTNRLFNLTLNRQKMPYNCKHHAAGGHFMCHDNRAELG